MNSDKDHIKKSFASKFRDFEAEIPASAWDRINTTLRARQGHQTPPRKKIWLRAASWVAGAAAIILIALLFEPEDFNQNANKQMAVVDEVNSTRQNKNTNAGNTEIKEMNNNAQKQISNKANVSSPIYANAKKNDNKIKKTLTTNQLTTSSNKELPLIENVDKELLAERSQTKGIEAIKDAAFEEELARKIEELQSAGSNDVFFADNHTTLNGKGLEFGVNGNSGFAKANNTDQVKKGSGVVLRNSMVTMKHEQPVTFGFNINKKLSDRLSIETGVSYTYLSSKSQSDQATVDILSKKQEFHYLGVPLSLNYTLLNWKKLQAYASIGGAVQKDFYGRVIEKKYNSALLNWEESSKENVSQMHPQFSATSSLGLSYPIYNKLRVYSTVGGAYYFNSENEHPTIYSEKKWMLNLNLGLKIEF